MLRRAGPVRLYELKSGLAGGTGGAEDEVCGGD